VGSDTCHLDGGELSEPKDVEVVSPALVEGRANTDVAAAASDGITHPSVDVAADTGFVFVDASAAIPIISETAYGTDVKEAAGTTL
jgi:hypothetical protein